MSRSDPSEQHATVEEIAEAVARLTPEELLRLRKRAELQLWGTEYTNPLELLGETVKRAMIAASDTKHDGERGRPWPINRVPLPAFLSRSMDSIADASRESLDRVATDRLEALASEDRDVSSVLYSGGHFHTDVVEQAIELEEAEARKAAAKKDAGIIEEHFVNDEVVLAIIEGEKEGMTAEEVRQLFDFDEKTYDTARRRLRRKVDKLMPGRRQK